MERLHTQLRYHWQDHACNKITSRLWARIDVDGSHNGFQYIGTEGVARALIKGAEVGCIDANIGEKSKVLPNFGQGTATDDLRFDSRHFPFRGTRKIAVDIFHNMCANNSITQKLQCVI